MNFYSLYCNDVSKLLARDVSDAHMDIEETMNWILINTNIVDMCAIITADTYNVSKDIHQKWEFSLQCVMKYYL